jgi:hypothetical protein
MVKLIELSALIINDSIIYNAIFFYPSWCAITMPSVTLPQT